MKLYDYLEEVNDKVIIDEGLKELALFLGLPIAAGALSIGLSIADMKATKFVEKSEMSRRIENIQNKEQKEKIIKAAIEKLKKESSDEWLEQNVPKYGFGKGGARESKIKSMKRDAEYKIEALREML
jgi:hypothetical protein